MSVSPFPFNRRPHDWYSAATAMAVGERLTWHSQVKKGVPDETMFSVQRLAKGWQLDDKAGELVGCFASLDAARDAGFKHVEKTEVARD